jgi:hypothetical protein
MSSKNSGKQTEKKSLGLGNKTALQIASTKQEEEKVSKPPSSKYRTREEAKKARKERNLKKGGYRYSELGMKGLTIAFGDDVSSKKVKNTTRKRRRNNKGKKGKKGKKGTRRK